MSIEGRPGTSRDTDASILGGKARLLELLDSITLTRPLATSRILTSISALELLKLLMSAAGPVSDRLDLRSAPSCAPATPGRDERTLLVKEPK